MMKIKMKVENTYILINKIELVDREANKNLNANILYEFESGVVYRADKISERGIDSRYVIYLDDDEDCENGVILDKKVLTDPDYNIHPLKSFDFTEISFSNAHEHRINEEQLLKLAYWEGKKEEEEKEDKADVGESRINERISLHPAYSVPMSFLKLRLYELRDENPDLFISIVGVIKNSLK